MFVFLHHSARKRQKRRVQCLFEQDQVSESFTADHFWRNVLKTLVAYSSAPNYKNSSDVRRRRVSPKHFSHSSAWSDCEVMSCGHGTAETGHKKIKKIKNQTSFQHVLNMKIKSDIQTCTVSVVRFQIYSLARSKEAIKD